MSGFWRAVLIGAVLGVLAVGGAVAVVASGAVPGRHDHAVQAAEGPILVALVMPNAAGAHEVRVVSVFQRAGDALQTSPVDPLTSATVPGTSATTLAEAYAFGGGDGLANAYAELDGGSPPVWVVVEPQAWSALMQGREIPVVLPADIEVFDGRQLYSYAQGVSSIPAAEVAQVMSGAEFLSTDKRAILREAVGDALLAAIVRSGLQASVDIETNLTVNELATLVSTLQSATVPADTDK